MEEADAKWHMLSDSIYMWYPKQVSRKQTSGFQELWGGGNRKSNHSIKRKRVPWTRTMKGGWMWERWVGRAGESTGGKWGQPWLNNNNFFKKVQGLTREWGKCSGTGWGGGYRKWITCHWIIHLQMVNFILCELSLDFLKKKLFAMEIAVDARWFYFFQFLKLLNPWWLGLVPTKHHLLAIQTRWPLTRKQKLRHMSE